METISPQILITGAGIAGLWCLRRMLALGYDAYLVEAHAIGAGQTLGAQGILHGGVKYGLDGTNREIADRLRQLPPRWIDCLTGRGELDLTAGRVHSSCQHLWAADNWLARVGASMGARALHGEVKKLETSAWPCSLRDGGHKGTVYQLEETVIDTRSVCAALAEPVADRILCGVVQEFEATAHGLRAVIVDEIRLAADVFLFTAATGNEAAAAGLGMVSGVAQRRPLKMLMARGPLPPLYGHCVTVSPKPIVTITTHTMPDGESVWYLGGGVAEHGATLSDADAIAHAQRIMAGIFPTLEWNKIRWAAWAVDRAEPAAASHLPDGPALLEKGNAALCWPTKMVYAPAMADRATEFVEAQLQPRSSRVTIPLPHAPMGKYPWESAIWK